MKKQLWRGFAALGLGAALLTGCASGTMTAEKEKMMMDAGGMKKDGMMKEGEMKGGMQK